MTPRFRRILAGATGMTYALMLLGVYTAAYGAGLTCGANWPFCDGAVYGLFPATFQSFVEWFHRLFAMIVGFVLLGTAGLAWRSGADRRVRLALTGAVALLPLQIGLGAVTVTVGGLVPWGYSPAVQAGHFVVALSILTLVTYATVRAFPAPDVGLVRRAAVGAAALVPVGYLFSYGGPLVYRAWTQTVYYGLTLGLFGLVLAVAFWSRHRDRAVARLAGASAVLVGVLAVLGRRLTGTVPPAVADAVTLAVFLAVLAAAWLAYRDDRPGMAVPTPGDSD
jgi:cytochrome c oxidase assembly protein subunit 15